MRDDEPGVGDDTTEPAELSLGEQLRAGREAQNLTLEQLGADLRIELRWLRALESNEPDQLGAPVFAKGYIKQIAGRLGLDYGDLLAAYYRLVGPTDLTMRPSRSIELRDESRLTAWVVVGLALLLVAVFALVWWLNGRNGIWLTAAELAAGAERAAAAAPERFGAD